MKDFYHADGTARNFYPVRADAREHIDTEESLIDDFSLIALEPEARLWAAVISLSITDASRMGKHLEELKINRKSQALKVSRQERDALYFLASEGLDNICRLINVDVSALRRKLKQEHEWARRLFKPNGFYELVHRPQ